MTQILVTEDAVIDLDSDSRLEIDVQRALDSHRRDHLLVGVVHLDVGVGTMEYIHGAVATRSVLQEMAHRLDRAIRRTDTRAHVRFGQFVVVLPGLGTQGDLQVVAEGLYRALRVPYSIDAQTVELSVHLGAAITSSTPKRVKALLKNAALAAREAQRSHSPIHISGSLFGSVSHRLRLRTPKARRDDEDRWTGPRMKREMRATSIT
jgi:GGDEF domain-containing protein